MRVLVLAAHPDDEVLGMGGTIARHVEAGDDVRITCVTDGSSTQYPGDAAKRRQKDAEAVRAARALGVEDFVHLDLPDMRLDTLPHVEVNAVVAAQLRETEAQVLYTVHPDLNADHRILFESVVVATRPTPGQLVHRVLTYGPASSTEWSPGATSTFHPNWFVDVTQTLAQKLDAFACYETERREYPHPRSERALRAYAAYYGAMAGCEAAEPFVLIRALAV